MIGSWLSGSNGRKERTVVAADMNRLRIGHPLRLEPFGLELIAESYLPNCVPSGQEGTGNQLLREKPVSAEPTDNIPGGRFRVRYRTDAAANNRLVRGRRFAAGG